MVDAVTLVALGLLFLLGLAADGLGRRTRLPRVSLLLALGLLVGHAGLDALPPALQALYEPLSVIALTMVAFLLGGTLSGPTLRQQGRAILSLSLAIVIFTVLGVAGGLWIAGVDPALALLLGGIAAATDPAATYDVIRQSRRDTPFTRRLAGIVAIDDAWGLIIFSLCLVAAQAVSGTGPAGALLGDAATEVGGAIALGLVIGLPAAVLTGRLRVGEPLRVEALGLVFLTAGLSLWLGVSYLLAGMTTGAVIANMARHHTSAFHEIEHLEWPFMLLFFLLAGATLEPGALLVVGPLGLGYILLRVLARIAGGWLGARLAHVPAQEHWLYGPALLPQAGVAIGMALIAAETFPEAGPTIVALAVGSTLIFELAGPVAAAAAIRRADAATPASGPRT